MATGWDSRPVTDPAGAEWLPALDIPAPGRQRRWTVLLRWLLLLPQYIVLFVLTIAAFFTTVVGWFAALFLGRLPAAIHDFLASFLAYQTRVTASSLLLVDRYPPFSFDAPDHPVQIEVRATSLNRLAVLFRLILMIPAAVIVNLLQAGWMALAWIFWLITLVLGRMPEPLFAATAAVARYRMRLNAYVMMLTAAYPKALFGDEPLPAAAEPAPSATRPLLLDTASKVLVVVFLVLGLAAHVLSPITTTDGDGSDGTDDIGISRPRPATP
ncbi:DUF4389 domain-containing protein [Streptomyces sp. NPDC002073]